jgi:hypothetical protein
MSTIATAALGVPVGAALTALVLAVTGPTGATGNTAPDRSTVVCARAAFLADDYAHTHTGARAERRAVAACAARVGGF